MNKCVYIETYGCRMNIHDSELILSILATAGYTYTTAVENADVIILNSCSVREDGHAKIYERLRFLEELKRKNPDRILIIAGCFTTFLNASFLTEYPFVNIIVHPNCYRNLPQMIDDVRTYKMSLCIVTENEELYDDISPIRCIEDQTTAAITVMKGCNQRCSYCIETYTRGAEHSRNAESVINEAIRIAQNGYKEITLVGHIIDKYVWKDPISGQITDFAQLLDRVAEACPDIRIKFLSSHPQFLSDEILDVIARNKNIMRVVHLPLQSASNRILQKMNRGYANELFIERVAAIRKKIPDMSIITDVMVGFCSETEDDFRQTVEMVEQLKFSDINVFKFSMRPHTVANELFSDDVTTEIKVERARIITALNQQIRSAQYREQTGKEISIIVEDNWKQNPEKWCGRDMWHRTIVCDDVLGVKINDKVSVKIDNADGVALYGKITCKE